MGKRRQTLARSAAIAAALAGLNGTQSNPALAQSKISLLSQNEQPGRPDENKWLKKAFALLRSGDVLKARMVYMYLAMNGSADAARGMGDTYNPSILAAIPHANAKGNEEQAVFWYKRGAEMERSAPVAISR